MCIYLCICVCINQPLKRRTGNEGAIPGEVDKDESTVEVAVYTQ